MNAARCVWNAAESLGESSVWLFVTTARTGLAAAGLSDQPLAGGLFAVEVDVAGLPARRFGG